MTITDQSISISLREWVELTAGRLPGWTLISFGLHPNSNFVFRLITRREGDNTVWVGDCGALFRDDTDWSSEKYLLTMRPGIARITWE